MYPLLYPFLRSHWSAHQQPGETNGSALVWQDMSQGRPEIRFQRAVSFEGTCLFLAVLVCNAQALQFGVKDGQSKFPDVRGLMVKKHVVLVQN